jgi:uncharacterized protein YbjT (DUF2867 family)
MDAMARVAIIGAHGKVAQQLERVLYDDGDDFVGVVRTDDNAEDVYRLGGEGVVLDLERIGADALADAIEGCDAVVFAAGAGPDSGVERKTSVDLNGSLLSQNAAQRAGIRRFVQVSAWGVDDPVAADSSEEWAAYVAAKRDADIALRAGELDWTIVRPGALTVEDGTGLVSVGERVPRGSVAREDVARVIAEVLRRPRTVHRQFELIAGTTPVGAALNALTA